MSGAPHGGGALHVSLPRSGPALSSLNPTPFGGDGLFSMGSSTPLIPTVQMSGGLNNGVSAPLPGVTYAPGASSTTTFTGAATDGTFATDGGEPRMRHSASAPILPASELESRGSMGPLRISAPGKGRAGQLHTGLIAGLDSTLSPAPTPLLGMMLMQQQLLQQSQQQALQPLPPAGAGMGAGPAGAVAAVGARADPGAAAVSGSGGAAGGSLSASGHYSPSIFDTPNLVGTALARGGGSARPPAAPSNLFYLVAEAHAVGAAGGGKPRIANQLRNDALRRQLAATREASVAGRGAAFVGHSAAGGSRLVPGSAASPRKSSGGNVGGGGGAGLAIRSQPAAALAHARASGGGYGNGDEDGEDEGGLSPAIIAAVDLATAGGGLYSPPDEGGGAGASSAASLSSAGGGGGGGHNGVGPARHPSRGERPGSSLHRVSGGREGDGGRESDGTRPPRRSRELAALHQTAGAASSSALYGPGYLKPRSAAVRAAQSLAAAGAGGAEEDVTPTDDTGRGTVRTAGTVGSAGGRSGSGSYPPSGAEDNEGHGLGRNHSQQQRRGGSRASLSGRPPGPPSRGSSSRGGRASVGSGGSANSPAVFLGGVGVDALGEEERHPRYDAAGSGSGSGGKGRGGPKGGPVVDERALERFMPQGKSSAAARALAPRTIAILKAWMLSAEHVEHPYPTDAEKEALALQCGISVRQVSVWMTNARKRIWMPLRQRGAGGGSGSKRGAAGGGEGSGYGSAADGGGGGPLVGGKRAAAEGRGLRARPGGTARTSVRGSRTSDDAEGYGEEGEGDEAGASGVGDSEEAHAHDGMLMLQGAGHEDEDDGDDEEDEEEGGDEEEEEDDGARGGLAGLAAVGARHGYSSGPQAKRPRRGSRPQESLAAAGAAGAAEGGSHLDAGGAGSLSATASVQPSPSNASAGLHRGARGRTAAGVAAEGGGAGPEPAGSGSAAGKGAKGAKGGKGWVRSLSHTSLESASSAAGMSLSTVAAALPAAPPVDFGSALSGGGGSAGAALAAGGHMLQLHASGAGAYSGADATQAAPASLHQLQAALPRGFAIVCVSPDPLTTVAEPADAAAATTVRALQSLAANSVAAVTAGASPADAQALLAHLSEQLSVAEPFVDRVLQSTAQHAGLLQQRLIAARAVRSRLSALREAVRHSTAAAAAGAAAPPQAGSGGAGVGGFTKLGPLLPAGASTSRSAGEFDPVSLHVAEVDTPGWLPQDAAASLAHAANLAPAAAGPGGLGSGSGVAPPLPAGPAGLSGGSAPPPR